jgi:hypothetical protein
VPCVRAKRARDGAMPARTSSDGAFDPAGGRGRLWRHSLWREASQKPRFSWHSERHPR